MFILGLFIYVWTVKVSKFKIFRNIDGIEFLFDVILMFLNSLSGYLIFISKLSITGNSYNFTPQIWNHRFISIKKKKKFNGEWMKLAYLTYGNFLAHDVFH